MMMMMIKKAVGSSRSFLLVGVLGSEQWRSVSNFPGLEGGCWQQQWQRLV